MQLALEGVPSPKPKHPVGTDTIGLDLGPSTIASVPRKAEARLEQFCEELMPDAQAICRLQRQMDRQRRATNPDNYDAKRRIKKGGKKKLVWKTSKGYEATRRRKATKERKLAAHRKSLHGRKVHELVAVGNTMVTEKISYKGWQKQYGRSVGLRAAPLQARAAPCTRSPHVPRSCPNIAMAVGNVRKNCSRSGFISALVASGRCSAICMRRFWRPILIQQIPSPRVPSMSFPGKVRRRACGQHTSEPCNVRMRGRSCPEA